MHTITEMGAGVPAFLAKLWRLVEDPETDHLICWSPNGKSFCIKNQAQFAKELLPHYYKHNNMASFVRQLNMYGFHKKVSVELGGLKCDKDEMEFAHQCFHKDRPYLLEFIKRKISSSKTQDPAHASIKSELMTKMLAEVRHMRGRQESLDNKLGAMKHENAALWRELAMLRQKHIKQQQIVNKLIHFLVTLVQPPPRAGGLSVKRRYPLMIDDSSRLRKQNKLQKPQASPTGPVIHELDASESDLYSEYIVAEMLGNETPSIHSPLERAEVSTVDNMKTVHLVDDSMQLEDDVDMIFSRDIDGEKKHIYKDKKKEELHLLKMPVEEASATIALPNKSVSSKPIPLATMRSPKLAAMVANINKCRDVEHDADAETSADVEDDTEISDIDALPLVMLKDILIFPEIIANSNVQNDDRISDKSIINKEINEINGGKSVLMLNNDKQLNKNGKLKHEKKESRASTSSSKDLSLSCVNSSGISDTNYRSESTEEMDTHLESMQSELDNLRDVLRGEGYSIDANTLLGLFGAEDPMTYELPINPELNPHCEREDDDQTNSVNRSAGGELMTYNAPSTLLDFDDDFLGNASSSLSTPTPDLSMNNLYSIDSSDPLYLEDNKTSLLDSLVRNNMDQKS